MSGPTINTSLSLWVEGEDGQMVRKPIEAILGNTSERTADPEDIDLFDIKIEDEDGEFILSGDRGEFIRILKFLNIEKGEVSQSGGF